jgi:hypothetical protein
MAGLKALDDCFASSERSMSKGYGPVSSDMFAAASDRCVVAHATRALEGGGLGGGGLGGGGLGGAKAAAFAAKKSSKAMPYALAVAHLLRQKGDNRKLAASLKQIPGTKLAEFAQSHLQLMLRRKGKSNTDKC